MCHFLTMHSLQTLYNVIIVIHKYDMITSSIVVVTVILSYKINTVRTNYIKHRDTSIPLNVQFQVNLGKRLYGHMFDMVDTAFSIEED